MFNPIEDEVTIEPKKKFDGFDFKWDEKFEVVVDNNALPPIAIDEIQKLIRNNVGQAEWKWFDWSWDVTEGPYIGKLPARISSFLYKEFSLKASTAVLGTIGDIAKKHMPSSGNSKVVLCFTKSLDWTAGKFGDGQSCFWQSRRGDRENIKSNGGMAVQAWDTKDWSAGKARVWAHLLDNKRVMIIYNAYGTLPITEFARAISTRYSCDYKHMLLKIGSDAVFVNNSTSYILGETSEIDKIIEKTGMGDYYHLAYKKKVMCFNCHCATDESRKFDGRDYCQRCFVAFVKTCIKCSKNFWHTKEYPDISKYGEMKLIDLCPNCKACHCPVCGELGSTNLRTLDNVDYRRCASCQKEGESKLVELLGAISGH